MLDFKILNYNLQENKMPRTSISNNTLIVIQIDMIMQENSDTVLKIILCWSSRMVPNLYLSGSVI